MIEDAVKKKELIPLKDFLDPSKSVYAQSWIPTPWEVVRWGLRQIGVMGGDSVEDKLVAGDFVVKANVEVRQSLATLRETLLTRGAGSG